MCMFCIVLPTCSTHMHPFRGSVLTDSCLKNIKLVINVKLTAVASFEKLTFRA